MGKWEMVRLGEISTINMGQSPLSESYNDSGEGVPFFQGKTDFGLVNPKVRVYCNNPIKIDNENDVLISVRAPVGAVNIASRKCCIGRGLAAISERSRVSHYKYLYNYLKYRENEIASMGVGSTFKAISKRDLNSILIPLPPLPVQQQIADVLDRANSLMEKRKAQIEKLDLLIKAQFIEMFGDPVTNPKGWTVEKLSEMGEVNRGVSKHRPRNDPKLLGGKYPLIQTGDVANAGLYIVDYSSTYSDFGLAQSKMWNKGTLCITIAANIAKTGILAFDSCFPDSIVGFVPNNRTNTYFINYWFSFFQKILEEQAPESAQKNINLRILYELDIICPPIILQNEFASFVQQVESQKLLLQQSLAKLEQTYKSLMQKCFRGEIF